MLFNRLGSAWVDEYRLIGRIWTGRFPEPKISGRLSWIESAFLTVLLFARSFSLHRTCFLVPDRMQSEFSELYVLGWSFVLAWLLWHPVASPVLACLVVGYRITEAMAYRLCILFVGRYEGGGIRSATRSLILLFINYFEITVGFATLYLVTNSIAYSNAECVVRAPSQALYFSLITITTLGYGDIAPLPGVGQWLVMAEVALGFAQVILLFSVFLASVGTLSETRRP